MRISASTVGIFLTIILPLNACGQDAYTGDVNKLVEAVVRLCSLPSKTGFAEEYEVSGGAEVKIKLVGIEGEGQLSKKEWDGIQDVLDKDRASERASSRGCVRNVLPIMLKAYGVREEVNTLLQEERKIHEKFLSGDPALRAVAFREAFRSVGTFVVDLTPINMDDKTSVRQETQMEATISNPVRLYDFESGKFADKEPKRGQRLQGYISGDSITFSAGICSGTLRNIPETWEFAGPVSCSLSKYNASFFLK